LHAPFSQRSVAVQAFPSSQLLPSLWAPTHGEIVYEYATLAFSPSPGRYART